MKKITAFIFTLGLSASYAFAADNSCYSCEADLQECKMMYGDSSPFCSHNYQACLTSCE